MRTFTLVLVAVSAAWGQSASSGAWTLQGGATSSSNGAPALISISLTPANPTQLNGLAVSFIATGTYSDGSTQNVTASAVWTSGNPSVAIVGALTMTQSVTCVAAGTSTISASVNSVVGGTMLTCQPSNVQTAALPTAWVDTHECDATLTSPNQTITFPSSGTGGSWTGGGPYASTQAGLNQAVADAEAYRNAHQSAGKVLINISAGTVFSGGTTITLPQTTGDASTNCIVLATTGMLPAGRTVCTHGIQDNNSSSTDVGTRNPNCAAAFNDVAQMWTLETTIGGGKVIVTNAVDSNGVAPHHFLIEGMEARPQAGLASEIFELIFIGTGNETLQSQLPSHIYFDRVWVHGDRTDAFAGSNLIRNDFFIAANIWGVTNSQISQSLDPGNGGGQESHGIWMLGAYTGKIAHNWIEGTSIDLFCGGAVITITTGQACNDLEVRRDRFSYPAAWLGTTYWPGTNNANNLTRKNATEFKSANRVLLDGNIYENVDDSGAQYRPLGLNPRAYNGASHPQYFVNVSNITITNDIFRHVCNQGSWWGTRGISGGSADGVSEPIQNITFSNNLVYDVNKPSFCGASDGQGLGEEWGFNDTDFTGCTAVRDSLGQTTTMTCFNTDGQGQAQTDTAVGDPVTVVSCVDGTFDVGGTVLGPPALAGTQLLTIVYSNPGTANASTTGCTFKNNQGYPKFFTQDHNTFAFTGSGSSVGGIYAGLTPSFASYAQYDSLTNSIVGAGGIIGQGRGDTSVPPEQLYAWDPATSIWHHDLMVTKTCSNYTEIDSFGGNQIKPPVNLYCPATNQCSGSDPTVGNCVGFKGDMSTGSFNVNPTDWHDFGLCHSGDAACANPSPFAAGQAHPASDGSDMGMNFTTTDNAETGTKYVCSSPCGPGPFAD